MKIEEIEQELELIHKREKELLKMKSDFYKSREGTLYSLNELKYNEFSDIANTINGFYFETDEKKRQEIFENKLMYVGQCARNKWFSLEEMINMLNEIDEFLGKHRGVMIIPSAKDLYLKIYPIILKYGSDVVYESERIAKIKN